MFRTCSILSKNVIISNYNACCVRNRTCGCGANGFRVSVVGAAGGIGQPLSLLLKQNPLISHLVLFDVAKMTLGVAADLSHINTRTKVSGYKGKEQIKCAVQDAHVVVITAGFARKPGMSRDDLFSTNANLIRDVVDAIAQASPKAIILIITNPVNSLVPVACEVLKKAKVLDPRRVMGVTTLDLLRTSTFIGGINKIDPATVNVSVIGGHSGETMIPVLSQSQPQLQLKDPDKITKLTNKIQNAGTEVIKAKAGGGSATLSTAYAGARLAHAVLRGLNGEKNVMDCAYVKSEITEAEYFASPLLFGTNGVQKVLSYGCLNSYEQQLFKNALPILKKNIKTGVDYIRKGGKDSKNRCK